MLADRQIYRHAYCNITHPSGESEVGLTIEHVLQEYCHCLIHAVSLLIRLSC